MPTRSERFRSEQERRQRRPKKKVLARKKAKKAAEGAGRERKTEATRRARKATYEIEPHAPGKRPSRKSTRGGANRVKPDAPFNRREELTKGSPESRAGRSRARTRRVRGSR
jgi:hypothetical protein